MKKIKISVIVFLLCIGGCLPDTFAAILQPGIEKQKPVTLQYEWNPYNPVPMSKRLRDGFGK